MHRGQHERAPTGEDEPRATLDAVPVALPRVPDQCFVVRDRCGGGRHLRIIGELLAPGFPRMGDQTEGLVTREGDARRAVPTTMSSHFC